MTNTPGEHPQAALDLAMNEHLKKNLTGAALVRAAMAGFVTLDPLPELTPQQEAAEHAEIERREGHIRNGDTLWPDKR